MILGIIELYLKDQRINATFNWHKFNFDDNNLWRDMSFWPSSNYLKFNCQKRKKSIMNQNGIMHWIITTNHMKFYIKEVWKICFHECSILCKMIKMICELIYDIPLHNTLTQDHEDWYFFCMEKDSIHTYEKFIRQWIELQKIINRNPLLATNLL